MAENAVAVKDNKGIIEYESNGEMIKLSPNMIRNYLVNGGGNVTDQEVTMFLSLCKYQHLNPFIRDAYLIKYSSNTPATMVTSKDVLTKRADRNPNYRGKQAGVIVLTKDNEIVEREGAFVLPNEQLVGGWAKVFVKGKEVPEYASVSFEEYAGRTKGGELNSQWKTKPATMIRKVAVMHALREAFPNEFQGLYAQEEFPEVSDIKLDTEKIVEAEIVENSNQIDFEIEDEE